MLAKLSKALSYAQKRVRDCLVTWHAHTAQEVSRRAEEGVRVRENSRREEMQKIEGILECLIAERSQDALQALQPPAASSAPAPAPLPLPPSYLSGNNR